MKKIIAIISGLAFLCACTGNFEEMNSNPYGVTDGELLQDNNYIGQHFPTMEKAIYYNVYGWGWDFQLIQNLTSDIWSGYMATPSNFMGGLNTQTYVLPSDWTDYFWDSEYDAIMINQLKIKEKCEEMGMDTYAHFNAICTVLKVMGMSRVVDEYGPIIYSKYGQSKTGGEYDSAQDAYKSFFSELKEASDVLYEYSQKECASFAKFDMSYGGDLTKWLKLCNTLRLRLALRIVKYDPALAKQEGEAAISAPGGLLQSGEGFIISGFEWIHPLYTCSIEYNDIFVSANLKSILGGYSDPRLELYGSAKKDEVLGVRSGIPHLDVLCDRYKEVISNINVSANTPGLIVSSAEPYFLLAEAALRGWSTSSDAKTYYEQGVKASFDERGVSMGDYLESHAVPAAFTDPLAGDSNSEIRTLASENSAAAVSSVTPCWNDASTDEEKLEKIITQKWIAGFPEGKNAWAEYRRTGYPKLFPVRENDSQGVISTEYGVRRLPFTQGEVSNNPEGYRQAVQLLGGPDNGATRIFWDINKGNFE